MLLYPGTHCRSEDNFQFCILWVGSGVKPRSSGLVASAFCLKSSLQSSNCFWKHYSKFIPKSYQFTIDIQFYFLIWSLCIPGWRHSKNLTEACWILGLHYWAPLHPAVTSVFFLLHRTTRFTYSMCTYPLPQLQKKNCVCTLFIGSPWPRTSNPPPFTSVEMTSLCHLLTRCWELRRALCPWGKHYVYGVTSSASPVLLVSFPKGW